MTSPAKIRANRRNAQRSTGPRTRDGKAIVARNALRHGLTLGVWDMPSLVPEVVQLARAIERSVIGAEAKPDEHALACRVAEALIDMRRVRDAKLPLVAALEADPCKFRAVADLARLDRYERHARTRRAHAICVLYTAIALRVHTDKTKPTEKRQ